MDDDIFKLGFLIGYDCQRIALHCIERGRQHSVRVLEFCIASLEEAF